MNLTSNERVTMWKDPKKIEIIRRELMNCSDKLSKEIGNLKTSLKTIEQIQEELQSILGGEQTAGPSAIHGGRARKASTDRFDRGE